jgi:hypothetical protein
MNLNSFLEKLKQTQTSHSQTIAVIGKIMFSPTAFENGILHNAAGETLVLVNCSLSRNAKLV